MELEFKPVNRELLSLCAICVHDLAVKKDALKLTT